MIDLSKTREWASGHHSRVVRDRVLELCNVIDAFMDTYEEQSEIRHAMALAIRDLEAKIAALDSEISKFEAELAELQKQSLPVREIHACDKQDHSSEAEYLACVDCHSGKGVYRP